jgi:hypothetical protein
MPITVCHIFPSIPRYLSSIGIFSVITKIIHIRPNHTEKSRSERRSRRRNNLPPRHRGHGVSDSEGRRTVGGSAFYDNICYSIRIFSRNSVFLCLCGKSIPSVRPHSAPPSGTGERRGFIDQFRTWANARVKHKLFNRLEHGYRSTGDGFLS